MRVKRVLEGLEGASAAAVHLKSGTAAVVLPDRVSRAEAVAAVERAVILKGVRRLLGEDGSG